MEPDQKQLTQLVAELRERLRLFAGNLSGGPAGRRDPGPLDVGERLALTSRVLAEGLEARGGREAAEAAVAFRELAGALEGLPNPLVGSEVATSLDELVEVMDDLACAWDRQGEIDLPLLWRRVRTAGDMAWPSQETDEPDSPAGASNLAPQESIPATGEVWLLVTGALRRGALEGRLRTAGYTVARLTDSDQVLERLKDHRPTAVVCDDAAPGRHHLRLQAAWPPSAPPLVLVRAGQGGPTTSTPAWMPPYRPEDLQNLL